MTPTASIIETVDTDEVQSQELTTQEQRLLRELLAPNAKVDVMLPDDLEGGRVLRYLDTSCRAYTRATAMKDHLWLIIGRLLSLVQATPSIYKSVGIPDFEEFLDKYVCEKLGISRSEAYRVKKLPLKFPGMTTDQYAALGSVKTTVLMRAFPGSDPVPKKYVTKAVGMTTSELKAHLASEKLIESGETDAFSIAIATNVAIGRQWMQFIGNPKVQAHVGSDRGDQILVALMQECALEWGA